MALVKDPVARAGKANTKLAAARLHLELESELGLNDDAPAAWTDQAEEAIGMLEAKAGEQGWGDLRDAALDSPDQGRGGWTPSLSHARRARHGSPAAGAPRARRERPPPPEPDARPAAAQHRFDPPARRHGALGRARHEPALPAAQRR
jgi:hypothetical protein